MSLRIRDTAASRTAIEARFRDGDGVTKPIERMYLRTEAGTRLFYERGIRVSVSPTSAEGFSSAKAGPIATGAVYVSVTGGSAPYNHSWAVSGPFYANAPAAAATNFVGTPPAQSGEIFGTATDTVTDANGLTAAVTVDVSISRDS